MDIGHGLVTLLSLSMSIKDQSLHKASWASHRFIIPSTYLCMSIWKTCCSLVMDPAIFGPTVLVVLGLGGPCIALSPGLRARDLESQVGRGPGHPGQEGDGLVLLIPGV